MKSCPAPKQQSTVDESKCKMVPAEVRRAQDRRARDDCRLRDRAHHRHHDSVLPNRTPARWCDTVIAVDSWLTTDSVPGTSDRRAFALAYAKKIGLDDMMQTMFSGQMAMYMARYQGQFSELRTRPSSSRGSRSKSTFRVLSGGPSCKSVKADSTQSAGNDTSSSNPLSEMSGAGKAVGQLMGGLFKKKKQPDDSAATPAAGSRGHTGRPRSCLPAAGADGSLRYGDHGHQDRLRSGQTFEIPADWSKEAPRESKASKDDFQCPRREAGRPRLLTGDRAPCICQAPQPRPGKCPAFTSSARPPANAS